MSDIENEFENENSNDPAETSGEPRIESTSGKSKKKKGKAGKHAEADAPAQASVRDLVANAGAAFGFLDEEPAAVEAAPQNQESGTDEERAPENDAPVSKKKRGGKKGKAIPKSEDEIVAGVEWNEDTKNLDFAAAPEAEAEADAAPTSADDSISVFEELARRVAATVSKNEHEDSDIAVLHALGDPSASIAHDAHEAAEAIIAAEASDIAQEMAAAHGEAVEDVTSDESLSSSASEEAHVITDTNPSMAAEELGHDLEAAPVEPEAEAPMEQTSFGALEEKLEAAEEDAAQEPTEFVESDQLLSIIESLLFSTDKPVSVATIKGLFKNSNVRTKDISRALDSLASEYASPARGVSLEEVNGGYQLRTKSDNADFMKRLAKVRPFRLSGPSLEVMSIVAYKQPVTKHEIDEIRGVESGHLLRALMERGLVAFGEKSDLPGKPMNYNSTKKFLEIFNLRNIRELPTLSEIDELLPEGIGEVEEKETLSDITDSMSSEITGDSYSEGEDELTKINEQLKAVDTTSEFFEQEKQRERDNRDRDRAQDIRERIVVGEEVDSKDRRWLDRYEAKLNAPAVEASGVPAADSAADSEVEGAAGEPGVGGDLEALTEESAATAKAKTSEDEEDLAESTDWNEDDEEPDDLSANPDWDEDVDKSGDV